MVKLLLDVCEALGSIPSTMIQSTEGRKQIQTAKPFLCPVAITGSFLSMIVFNPDKTYRFKLMTQDVLIITT